MTTTHEHLEVMFPAATDSDLTAAHLIVLRVLGEAYAHSEWAHERALEAWREAQTATTPKPPRPRTPEEASGDVVQRLLELRRRYDQLTAEISEIARERGELIAGEVQRRGRGGIASLARELGIKEQSVRQAMVRDRERRSG